MHPESTLNYCNCSQVSLIEILNLLVFECVHIRNDLLYHWGVELVVELLNPLQVFLPLTVTPPHLLNVHCEPIYLLVVTLLHCSKLRVSWFGLGRLGNLGPVPNVVLPHESVVILFASFLLGSNVVVHYFLCRENVGILLYFREIRTARECLW